MRRFASLAEAMQSQPDLSRVSVVGPSCAGKTTLAARLARALGSPHVELDALHWGPGWQACEPGAFRARVAGALRGERWICDGNYGAVRDLVWQRASCIVWLDYAFARVAARALRRTCRRVASGETLYGGNRESFRQSFLSRDSILLWVLRTHHARHRRYAALRDGGSFPQATWLTFRHPTQVERFVAHLEARRGDT